MPGWHRCAAAAAATLHCCVSLLETLFCCPFDGLQHVCDVLWAVWLRKAQCPANFWHLGASTRVQPLLPSLMLSGLAAFAWRQQQLAVAGVQPSVVLVHAPCLDSVGRHQASTCLECCTGGCGGRASASLCGRARPPPPPPSLHRALAGPACRHTPPCVYSSLPNRFKWAARTHSAGQRSLL